MTYSPQIDQSKYENGERSMWLDLYPLSLVSSDVIIAITVEPRISSTYVKGMPDNRNDS